MSRPRFLADHDLNEHIVAGVMRLEPAIEFFRVRAFGMADRSDKEILNYAQRQGLLIVSHDVNTMPAAAFDCVAAGQSFPGLFMIQQSSPIGPMIESLVLIWVASEMEEWKDLVAFLPFE